MRWRAWLKMWAGALTVWSLLALLYAFQQSHLALMGSERRVELWPTFLQAWRGYAIIALITPFVIQLGLRLEFRRGRMARFLAIHAAAFTLFVAAHTACRVALYPVRNMQTGREYPRTPGLVRDVFLLFLSDDLFMYFPIVAGAMGFAAFAQARDREMAQSALRAQLAGAELEILKMQLHPHFLFNTLQAISTLVGKDPQAAKRMIGLLADLLRAAIDHTGEQEAPLRDELDLLDRYVQIEQVRFGERLRVEFDIDGETLGCLVPSLLMQPLVENAIRHGARAAEGNGVVTVRSRREGEYLRIAVEDNGPGMPHPESRPGNGLGLENTRARLTRLYGAQHRLELSNRSGGGLAVAIELPARLRS
jgi:two-component system, LytTR family, sensor kinase